MSSSPQIARSCPELASFRALHESQFPLWDLHLLWCGGVHDLHGRCLRLWFSVGPWKWGISALEPGALSPSFFTSAFGVCRVFSLSQVLISAFYLLLNRLSLWSHWWAQLWAVAGLTRSLLALALSDVGVAPGVLTEANPITHPEYPELAS